MPTAAAALFLAALGSCDSDPVVEPEPSLEIVPDSVTLTHIGERFAFSVRGGGGPESGAVRWSSRDTTVFVVDGNGSATARRNGVAYVHAADKKSADQALVQVRQAAAALETFGDAQRAAPGLSLLDPVGARVLDAGGTPVSGVAVRFEAQSRSGRVDPAVAWSDSLGLAPVEWTLGSEPGRQTLTVSTEGVAGVEIVATALEPEEAVASFEVRSGGDQWAWSGRTLAEPIVVSATDEGGRPVPGAAVRFEPEAGGRADPETAGSDSAGVASTAWTLGTAPGPQTLAISTGDHANVEIIATARDPDEAVASVEAVSGDDQWAVVRQALPDSVTVHVSDETGRPIWGAAVTFEPGVGSGWADPNATTTDSLGLASAVWTLGSELGAQRVGATAGSTTVTFEATAVSDEGVCNRTPAVSTEIARQLGAANCAEVTEDLLGGLTQLNLYRKGIRELRRGDFGGLPALGVLYLHENQLTELPRGVFDGLDGLRTLYLYENQLTELPPGILDALPELRSLSLGGNRLSELAPGLLANLTQLDALNLGHNQLSELPSGIFAGLSRLRRLSLDYNQLPELPSGIFRGLSGLRELNLGRNRLTAIATAEFANLGGLERLALDYNELQELPSDLFNGLTQLKNLGLNGNRLTSLPEGIFDGLSRLEHVWLRANRLTELPPQLFADKPALIRIQLGNNELTELPPELFSETQALRRLLLHGNRLSVLPPDIFAGLDSLTRLDLDANALVELPSGIFRGTPRLAHLSLMWNQLEELPRGVFTGLSQLEWVTLRGNPGEDFGVEPEFVRVDAGDPLAPGPARLVVRVPLGAPFAFDMPVSVQRGKASRDFVSFLPGDSVSAPITVSASGAGATHVGFGPPPRMTAEGYTGLELVRGEELVLFAETDNRSPVARSRVRAHRLQDEGPSADVMLSDYFGDPDGDSLGYRVATTESGVVNARIDEGILWLDPLSVDTTEVEVTASDPDGLRATQRFLTWVVPAPDSNAFNIELYFEPGFTPEEEDTIRRAADRWMEVVTGDLPDVPLDGLQELIEYQGFPRSVGVIDDLLIEMTLSADQGAAAATAGVSGRREESGHAFLAGASYDLGYVRDRSREVLYELALHEIGHVLGIGGWNGIDRFRRGGTDDPHFAGPLAVAAFNAAGGETYSDGKVPLEDRIPVVGIHWRQRVIPRDVMAPYGDSLLTAITVQTLADLGYEVDVNKADPYTLPGPAQGDVRGWGADAEGAVAELFTDDVIEGPVVVVDRDGKVVRVIRP
ncbi:MAG: leucine-rich repeat domain-containing protein [Gammaproteobacteria bacterium]|nr:leucine-rich repeat domain-containing protein [Gammaproteobacteria bacterium]